MRDDVELPGHTPSPHVLRLAPRFQNGARLLTGPEEAAESLAWRVRARLFNHQTHHRGQVHDQLSQTTVAPPPLDLIFYLRETGDPR